MRGDRDVQSCAPLIRQALESVLDDAADNEKSTVGDLGELTPYVPKFVRARLAESGLPEGPVSEARQGAALIADVSGFTALTETLAAEGGSGAERLRDLINVCFAELIEVVDGFGGDVVHFAGDAALAVWLCEPADAVARALACAEQLGERIEGRKVEDYRLRLRVGVDAGEIILAYVGGAEGRWQYVVHGGALAQAIRSLAGVSPGEIGYGGEIEPNEAAPTHRGSQTRELDQAAFEALTAFVPRPVQARIGAGQAGWLAEFRQVTTSFLSLPASVCEDLEQLQQVVVTAQEAVYRAGGSILQVLLEDKGLTVLSAWGTAQRYHEDNPRRAVHAAHEISKRLDARGVASRQGITTATVFTGSRGSARRRDFAIIGDGVNLAARLTQASDGRPLVDAVTRSGARGNFVFEGVPPVTVKGKVERVPAYRLSGESARAEPGRTLVIGRRDEVHALDAAIESLEREGDGGVVFIEGQPGIGKSNLRAHLLEEAQSAGLRTLLMVGDVLDRSTTQHAWRGVFRRLVGVSSAARIEEINEIAAAVAERLRGGQDLTSLLNPVLGSTIPRTEAVARMTAEGRSESARDLLVDLLVDSVGERPTVLVCEDAHWFDSASIALVRAARERLPRALCVVFARDHAIESGERGLHALVSADEVVHLPLLPLDPDGSTQLVCHTLGADLVPEDVTDWVHSQAGGHPFLTEQLTRALRDERVLLVREGEAHLQGGASRLDSVAAPDNVQNLVTSRLDRLEPEALLALKVLAIAGARAHTDLLLAIHPMSPPADALERELATLAADGRLVGGTGQEWTFEHAIARDVVYETIAFAQKRELHAAAADWLEQEHGEMEAAEPVLAHHWQGAGEPAKSIEYLERAGRTALRAHANPEAALFFGDALELATSEDVVANSLRRARWHRLRGKAHFRMWDFVGASRDLDRALQMLETPLPKSGAARVRFFGAQLIRQALLLAGRRPKVSAAEQRERFEEAAGAAALVSFICTHRKDAAGVMAASLLAANLSDRAGVPNARAHSLLGFAASALGWRRLARRYFDRAREHAQEGDQFQDLPHVLTLDASDLLGAAEFEDCSATLESGIEAAESMGDRNGVAGLTSLRANMAGFHGDFDGLKRFNAEALEIVSGRETTELEPYFRIGLLHAEAMVQQPEEAYLYLQRVKQGLLDLMEEDDKLLRALLAGGSALICAHAGRVDEARQVAQIGMGYLTENVRAVPASCWLVPDGIAEAYLDCCELAQQGGVLPDGLLRDATKAVAAHAAWSKVYRFRRSRSDLLRGRLEALRGRYDRAVRALRASFAEARELDLPFDQALAQLELARVAGKAEPLPQAAIETLEAAKAPYYRERAMRVARSAERVSG